MLRRVSRALRSLLTIAGATAVVLLPASFFITVFLVSAWPVPGVEIYIGEGAVVVTRLSKEDVAMDYELRLGRSSAYEQTLSELLRHQIPGRIYMLDLAPWRMNLPLWLLAFLCLAWPVTSFIVSRRRRRRRGFEVEPKPESAVSTADS